MVAQRILATSGLFFYFVTKEHFFYEDELGVLLVILYPACSLAILITMFSNWAASHSLGKGNKKTN
jgi:hypothetical protein